VSDVENIHKHIQSEVEQDASTRRRFFAPIEKELSGRALITFFTSFNQAASIDDNDCDRLQSLLQHIDTSKGVALMINSPGGDGLAAERIVESCRAYSGTGDYWVIVPGKAKSAATIIAMGASKIYMAPSSELGPVDPQILRTIDGQRRIFSAHSLVKGYDRLFKEATETKGNLEPYIQQLGHYDDREINLFRTQVKLAEFIAVKVLGSGMMTGKTPQQIKDAIKVFLDPDAGTYSHGRPIYSQEAKQCDLSIENISVGSAFWKSVYELYARSEKYVTTHVAKAMETKRESFYGV
jgi:hypothetical protein